MVQAEERRLACLVPGAGVFPVEVKGAQDVDILKLAIKEACPEHFADVQAIFVKLYALKSGEKTWFAYDCDDVRRLAQGDASTTVRELMQTGEIDALAAVDDVFGDATRKGVVHVLATAPGWSSTRLLTCVVPGDDVFRVEVKGSDDINSLKKAIQAACPGQFADGGVEVFPLLLENNSKDVRLLIRGDASARVREVMAKNKITAIATIDEVFGERYLEKVVHVLAVNPTRTPRPALKGELGKRARPHWDTLNIRLKSLKRGKGKTAPLSKIAWSTIERDYIVQDYSQEPIGAISEVMESVRREVKKSIKSIRAQQSEMECTCILFSLFRELFCHCRPPVKMSLQAKLQSCNNVLEAGGFADFVFYRRNIQVCVMEAKKVKNIVSKIENESEDEDEDENEVDEDEDDEITEPQKMVDGFAQALVGMELQNTFKSDPNRSVRGLCRTTRAGPSSAWSTPM